MSKNPRNIASKSFHNVISAINKDRDKSTLESTRERINVGYKLYESLRRMNG